ncbi:MAG: hypothetical protein ACK4N5_21390, partial [Myxococcales bacterium]
EDAATFPPSSAAAGPTRRALLIAQHRALEVLLADLERETSMHHDEALALTMAQTRTLLVEHEERELAALLHGREPPAEALREFLRERRLRASRSRV